MQAARSIRILLDTHLQPSSRLCLSVLLIALAPVSASSGQRRRGYPTPPPPAVPEQSEAKRATFEQQDTATMERESRELSALAATIPGDVERLKQGLLPKDAVEKLKRIEKLSRQLRGQIRQ